jgi:hypothetical protein
MICEKNLNKLLCFLLLFSGCEVGQVEVLESNKLSKVMSITKGFKAFLASSCSTRRFFCSSYGSSCHFTVVYSSFCCFIAVSVVLLQFLLFYCSFCCFIAVFVVFLQFTAVSAIL